MFFIGVVHEMLQSESNPSITFLYITKILWPHPKISLDSQIIFNINYAHQEDLLQKWSFEGHWNIPSGIWVFLDLFVQPKIWLLLTWLCPANQITQHTMFPKSIFCFIVVVVWDQNMKTQSWLKKKNKKLPFDKCHGNNCCKES